jgi:gas vesicle structural protein
MCTRPSCGRNSGQTSDLINRVLDKGVVISGHVTISVADVDLIALDLRLLVTSIQTAMSRRSGTDAPPAP